MSHLKQCITSDFSPLLQSEQSDSNVDYSYIILYRFLAAEK